MNAEANIVNRAVLELQVSAKEDYLKLRDELDDLINNKLPEKLEALCTNIFSSEEIIRLDRLEIDIGTILTSQVSENILQKFKSVVEEKLVRIKKDGAYVKKKSGSLLDLLTYFLSSGDLPWWSDKKADINLNNTFRNVLKENPKELLDFLVKQAEHDKVLSRIENQFSPEILESVNNYLVNEYFPGSGDLITNIRRLLIAAAYPYTASARIEKTITMKLLGIVRDREKLTEVQLASEILNEFVSVNSMAKDEFYDKVVSHFKKISASAEAIYPELLKLLTDLVLYQQSAIIDKQSNILLDILKEQNREENSESLRLLSEKKLSLKDSKPIEIKIASESIDEIKHEEITGTIINNAGISLISVYLPLLFSKINLLKQGIFENKANAERGALLINYITHNKIEDYEFNLQLNKILCGIPLTESLPAKIEISATEIEEINALLNSVIKYWTAIKSTSVDGLRSAFLQRQGILYNRVDSFQLKVDREPHDIILETLPWSISIIKFKWMNKPVYVEW